MKDAGAAVRALMASDLIPSALDLVDAEALRALEPGGREGAALLVGLDGIREQVEWQCAELPRILGTGARVDARVLDGAERDALWQAAGALPRAGLPRGHRGDEVGRAAHPGGRGDGAGRRRARGAMALAAAFSAHAGDGHRDRDGAGIVGSGGGGPVAATTVASALGDWRALVQAARRACDARVGAAGGEGAGAGLGRRPARRTGS